MAAEWVHFLVAIVRVYVMGASLLLKIPQILTIYRANSSKGVNLLSILLETWWKSYLFRVANQFKREKITKIWYLEELRLDFASWSMSFSYSFANNYPWITMVEYPILMAQCLILALLIVQTRNQLHPLLLLYFGIYNCAVFLIASGIVPSWLRSILMSCNMPISSTSKVLQIRSILVTKDAGKVSRLTCFFATSTSYGRFFVNILTIADKILMSNFFVAGTLNGILLVATMYYKNASKKKLY